MLERKGIHVLVCILVVCATFSPSRLGSKLAMRQKTRKSLEIFPKWGSDYLMGFKYDKGNFLSKRGCILRMRTFVSNGIWGLGSQKAGK